MNKTWLLCALLLGGCSGPQVRTLGTGGGAPAYELIGDSLAAVQGQAHALCPKGYDVLRQSQRFRQPLPEDNAGAPALQQAGDWLSGLPGNQAQATVQCRA